MQTYDITNWMSWWVNQCISIFTFTYNTLDSIQFAGTSILRIIIWVAILGALFKVALTIPQGIANNSSSERVKEEKYDKEKILRQERAIQEKAGIR